ncbi:hypothetical protein COOONC_13560 [Cooperia oncophora]
MIGETVAFYPPNAVQYRNAHDYLADFEDESTTDIWRSYVAQKLLHMIGETVAFYPPNAVQYRNAHDYLGRFRG